MLPFPQMPAWRPDEIIGSVLANIIECSALGSKHALLDWLGFEGALHNRQYMDICTLLPRWVHLARQLQIDLEQMIRSLTTVPYWACFYKDTPPRRVKGRPGSDAAEATEASQGCFTGKEASIASNLSLPVEALFTRRSTLVEMRICPDCLRAESAAGSAPYLHRSHQLPATRVCHRHRARLICRCPSCGAVLADSLDLVSIASRCRCGHSFGNGTAHVSKRSAIYKLAVLEHECLHSAFPPRGASDVISFIRGACRERNVQLMSLARDTFGQDVQPWTRADNAVTRDPRGLHLAQHGMPSICTALVALDYEFATIQAELGRPTSFRNANRAKSRLFRPQTTKEARTELLALKASGEEISWGRLHSRSRFVFWWLFLEDKSWLMAQRGPLTTAVSKVPTVAQDRSTLLRLDLPLNRRLDADARAYCRDKDWLDGLAAKRDACLVRRTKARDAMRIRRITAAIEAHYKKLGRPKKFTIRDAAHAAGLCPGSMLDLHRKSAGPYEHLWESTTHFRCRLLRWGLDRMVQRGKSPTPNLLLVEAGLSNLKICRFYAASVIHLFAP